MKKRLFALCIAVCTLLLAGCGKTTDVSAMDNAASCNISGVEIGSLEELNISFGESGFFYTANSLIRYYDPSTAESYILCNKPNCVHKTSSCIAYFPKNWTETVADWVAQHNGYVYCVAADDGAISLWKVDYKNGTKDVVASFSQGYDATDNTSISCSNIDNVLYAGDYAFARVALHNVDYSVDYTQLAAINLENGEVTWLAEDDGWNYYFECVCTDYVLYSKTRYLLDEVSETDYYEQFGDGPATIEGIYFDSYYDYWCWFTTCAPIEYAFYAFDVSTGQTVLFEEGTVTEEIEGYGTANPNKLYGTYDGKVVCGVYSMPESELLLSIYLQDLQTGEKTLVADLGTGSNLIIAQGYASNQTLSDGSMLCQIPLTNEENSDIQVYRLNLSTGELVPLFVDNYYGTFRIFSETEDGYYGKWYDAQDTMEFYWISKADYNSGNLDAAIKYQV